MECNTLSLSLIISPSLPKFMSVASVIPSSHLILWCCLLLCPQSFSASGTFPKGQLVTTGGQSIGASASDLLMNIQGWFPLRLTGLISVLSKGLSRVFSSTRDWRFQFFGLLPSLRSSSHNRMTFVGRVVSLLPKTSSRFVIAFLPRSNHLLISWLQSPSIVIFEPKKKQSVSASTFSPSICHDVMRPDATILVFSF